MFPQPKPETKHFKNSPISDSEHESYLRTAIKLSTFAKEQKIPFNDFLYSLEIIYGGYLSQYEPKQAEEILVQIMKNFLYYYKHYKYDCNGNDESTSDHQPLSNDW